MPFHIDLEQARLSVIWCDRCGRSVNRADEKDHFHREQCGGCRKYKKINTDWGWCKNLESVYCGRPMFEHDTCSKFIEGEWK
jgi:ribosomal protein S27AE